MFGRIHDVVSCFSRDTVESDDYRVYVLCL